MYTPSSASFGTIWLGGRLANLRRCCRCPRSGHAPPRSAGSPGRGARPEGGGLRAPRPPDLSSAAGCGHRGQVQRRRRPGAPLQPWPHRRGQRSPCDPGQRSFVLSLPCGPRSRRLFSQHHQRRGLGQRLLLARQVALQIPDALLRVLRLARDLPRGRAVPVVGPLARLTPDPDLLGIEAPAAGSIPTAPPRSSPQSRSPPRTCPAPSSPRAQPGHRAATGRAPGPQPATATACRSISPLPARAAGEACCGVEASSRPPMPSAPSSMPPFVLSSARLRP